MKIAVQGSAIYVKDTTDAQYKTIRSWGLMQWDKRAKLLVGAVSKELLDRLSRLVQLPPTAEAARIELQRKQDAIDRERVNPAPVPLASYPVKKSLYQHQVRGANMALLTFGWVKP